MGDLRDSILPSGAVRIVLGPVAGRWPRPRVGVPVQLLVDNRLVRSLTVWVEIREERTVLTYAATYRALTPGTRIGLIPALVDMTCCAGTVIADRTSIVDARLKRAVVAGQPVMASALEPMPDVVAQERVAIEVIHGPVHLQTSGIAMHDGRIGDQIAVRAEQSPEPVLSRVVAKQKVVIDD